MDLARLRWLDGNIAGGLGRLVQAEDLLQDVRDFFVECGFGVDVFSVSLDLAGMYAENRQRQQAKRVLGEIIPLGEALGLGQDVFLARLLYEQVSRA